jgi:hypothetical protein
MEGAMPALPARFRERLVAGIGSEVVEGEQAEEARKKVAKAPRKVERKPRAEANTITAESQHWQFARHATHVGRGS